MTEHASAPAFRGPVSHGESIQWDSDGFTFTATIEQDSGHGTPWDNEDGHGTVTEWLRQDPGEGYRELYREGRAARYYDYASALETAARDGWDAEPYGTGTETAEERAARAVSADFERLRAWCHDEWFYVGVCVVASRAGVALTEPYDHALWGIESDCPDYLTDVARELAQEAAAAARDKLRELCA